MKHLFIINPAAGSRDQTAFYTDRIKEVFGNSGEDYRIAVSTAPGDCTRVAREAAASGEEYRIYACGGDGTLNEVVTGVVGFPNVAVSVFSGGSGNDFIKIFNDPDAFFHLERFRKCEESTFDLIRCNDDYSLNICSVGLDARIGRDVIKYKRLPMLGGFRAYVLSTVVNIVKGIAEHYVVQIGDQIYDGKHTFVCVCNGQYYGGGFHPVPEADPTDRMLDVLLVGPVRRLEVPMIIGKYKNGRYRELSYVAQHFRTDRVKVICDRPTPASLDGEVRTAEVFEMSLAPEKIRFFHPAGLCLQVAPAEDN